jgi:hypothetical protein
MRWARRSWLGWAVPILAIVVSLAGFLLRRWPLAADLERTRQWSGFCQRVHPPDTYPCHVDTSGRAVAFLVASMLLWVALAGGPAILALAGRRWWSLAPLGALTAAVVGSGIGGWFGHQELSLLQWLGPGNAEFTIGVDVAAPSLWSGAFDLVLLALPALAIVPWRPRLDTPGSSPVFAALSAVGAIAILVMANGRVTLPEIGISEGISIVIPGSLLLVFGLLISGRSPWWPWSVLVLAVVLSLGPSAWVMSSAVGMTTTLWFGTAIWLAAIGLVASMHVPLARVARRKREAPDVGRRRLRPIVLANAVGLGLIAVSLVAANADPLVPRFSAALPTFRGLRERAELIRVVENAAAAYQAFDGYRRRGGDVDSFDEDLGTRLAPNIPWDPDDATHAVDVRVTRDGGMRFVVDGGVASCVQASARTGWVPTFGTSVASNPERAVRRAVDRCGDAPLSTWDPPALRLDSMCDGLARDGIVICRAVQYQARKELSDPFA